MKSRGRGVTNGEERRHKERYHEERYREHNEWVVGGEERYQCLISDIPLVGN